MYNVYIKYYIRIGWIAAPFNKRQVAERMLKEYEKSFLRVV